MPAKKPQPRPHLVRLRDAASAHPAITYSAVAAAVPVLAVILSGALWVFGFFETAGHAKQHAARDEQRAAWLQYGQADLKVLMLRNRLNDCNVKRSEGRASEFDRAPCQQYQQEYDEAVTKQRDLYTAAMATTKEWE